MKRSAEMMDAVEAVHIRLFEQTESDDPISQWSSDVSFDEAVSRPRVYRNGRFHLAKRFSERERFRFTHFGRDEWLECAITPGMPSFMFTRPTLRNFAEKTVRWPGHFDAVDVLKWCGLLELTPVIVDGVPVVPRQALLACIKPRLRAAAPA